MSQKGKTPKIRLIVAAHKEYEMPQDPMYLPLQVGAAGKDEIGLFEDPATGAERSYYRDDCGDNISKLNSSYCELTGLYWGWKNLDADYIGLVHYRRHFTKHPEKMHYRAGDLNHVLSTKQALRIMDRCDIAVPKKRKYHIETLYSHYAHTFTGHHLDIAEEVIRDLYPQDLDICRETYKQKWGYMFNMCIMSKELLDDYCSWLFSILFEVQKRLEAEGATKQMTAFEGRLYGRISEVLFNVWLNRKIEEGCTIEEIPLASTEPVNWLKKGSAFLAAKFFGVKYSESF